MMSLEKEKNLETCNPEPITDEFAALEIQLCKQAIEWYGIRRYEKSFKHPNDIPYHRALDASHTRSLLLKNYADINQLIETIDEYLKTIKTGLLIWGFEIYHTGKSQFKTYILESMALFRQKEVFESTREFVLSQRSKENSSITKSQPISIQGHGYLAFERHALEISLRPNSNVTAPENASFQDSLLEEIEAESSSSLIFASQANPINAASSDKPAKLHKKNYLAGMNCTENTFYKQNSTKFIDNEDEHSMEKPFARSALTQIEAIARYGMNSSNSRQAIIAMARGELSNVRVGSVPDRCFVRGGF